MRALTSLRVTDAALEHGSNNIDLREIFECAHLKFTVYGRKQARTYICMLTHFRNAVPLVWGSLRLAPIIHSSQFV